MKDVDSSIFQNQFKLIKNELNEDIVRTLLGDFNWRTRKVGAIFTIVKNYSQFEEIIGNHLLKSEVCYAGRFYALALAYINTDSSVRFLKQYLEYYLTRHDLDFDQVIVMNALVYLDAKNNTKVHESLLSLWHDYITPINQTREESYNKHPQYYPKGFIPFDLEANEWITRTLDSYIKLGNM